MKKPKEGRFDIGVHGEIGFRDAEIMECQTLIQVKETLDSSDFIIVKYNDYSHILSTKHITSVSKHLENFCDKCGAKSGDYSQCSKCLVCGPVPF